MKRDRRALSVCMAAILFVCLMLTLCCVGCASQNETPSLERPASIVVCSGGVETEHTEANSEYSVAFELLKGTNLDVALERTIDPDMESSLKEGDCIEFIYDNPQRTGGDSPEVGAVEQEYDKLLFCFTGPIAGEVVLGLGGRYMSGTYEMDTTAWPY